MPRRQGQAEQPAVGESIGEPAPSAHSRAAAVLALSILFAGILAAASTAYIIVRYFSPIIVLDEWEIIRVLSDAGANWMSWAQLWAQHNEHRVLVANLACLLDLNFFHGKTISLVVEICAIQVAAAALLTWMFCRLRKSSRSARVTAAGLFLFCALSPLQMENFMWGFQVAFVFALFAGPAAFACILCLAGMPREAARQKAGLLILALALAFLAEGSLAAGLLLWPMLLALGYWFGIPRWMRVATAAVGAAAIGLYFQGYHSGRYATPLHTKLLHPVSISKYAVTYFAFSWDGSLPSVALWPTLSEWIAMLAMVSAVGCILWTFLGEGFRIRPNPDPLRAFLSCNMLFALATAALTATARLDLGIRQATSGRYQLVALLFWGSLIAFLLALVDVPSQQGRFLEIQAVVLLLLLASFGRFSKIAQSEKERQAVLAQAYSSLAFLPGDPPVDLEQFAPIYPITQWVPVWYEYLRVRGLGPDPKEYLSPTPHLTAPRPDWGGYKVVSGGCEGAFELRRLTTRRVVAEGWAWDNAANRSPARIVLASSGGMVGGFGAPGEVNREVEHRLKPTHPQAGWVGEALASPDQEVQAFAVLEDTKSICALGGPAAAP